MFNYAGLLHDQPPGAAGLPFISSSDSEAIRTAIALRCVHYDAGCEQCKTGLAANRPSTKRRAADRD